MKRVILTAMFAIGLSALFAACNNGGGGGTAAVPYNACTTGGYVQTTCGCIPQTSVTGQCTITNNGLYGGGLNNGLYTNGLNNGFGYSSQLGGFGSPVTGFNTLNQVPPCAYTRSCFYQGAGYRQGYPYYGGGAGWYFYVNIF